MSLPLFLGCIWVIVATLVAFLPMKIQMVVGLPLVVAALGLIGWIGARHGVWIAAFGLFAFVSMFRKPILFYWRKLRNPDEANT